MTPQRKSDVIAELQSGILRLQGFKSSKNTSLDLGLGSIINSFPCASFPLGAVHEFLSEKKEDAASTSGFILGLLSSLMGNSGVALWISSSRTLFPPALKSFGIDPGRIIFIDLKKEKDVSWAMEEALKCNALAAVVGEMCEIDFTSSRRLQLAVEHSQVTGFVLRNNFRQLNTTACISRWKIAPLRSELSDLPGIGFPKWKIELLRIRNGKPGSWELQWISGKFVHLQQLSSNLQLPASNFQYQESSIRHAG